MDITFLRPHFLMALIVLVPAVLGLWYLGFQRRRSGRALFGEEKLVSRYTKPLRLAGEIGVAALWVVAVTLIVGAAAGPISKSLPTNVKAGTLQVVGVVDVSKSMSAEEYRPFMPPKNGYAPDLVPGPYGNRLDYVKLILQTQVMPAIIGNQLGVVTYSGNGFEQIPLTDDWTSSKWVMDNWIRVGNAPGGGSDYAEGLTMALAMLDRDKVAGREQVIVLFSDGGFTGDEKVLADAVQKIREKGIRFIIVGVGSISPQPIPEYNKEGQLTGYFKEEDKVSLSGREEANLSKLVAMSGAEYLPLDPGNGGQLKISWAASLGGSKAETKEDPIYQWPLGLAIILLTGLFIRGALPRQDLVR